MKVTMRFFASIKEQLGRDAEEIEVPAAIAPGIWCVRSLSTMQSRMKAVLIITSTAATRPLPSALGMSRCETTALSTVASCSRICFC